MAKADGSVIIDTRMDARGFMQGAQKLQGTAKSACEKLSAGFGKLGMIIGAAFSVAKIVQFGVASSKAARELSDAMTGLQSIVEGQGRSFAEAQSFIDEYTKDGLIPATNAITAYKNLASRGYDDSQIQQTMIALKDAAAFGRQSALSMGDAVQGATEGLKNENSMLVDNAGVTKNVAKMWDEYAASIGTTANNLTQQQKIQAEVAGIMQETQFQTGDAAKVAGTLSGQLQQLSFNFNNLKVAVGGIINPIVQHVLPVINAAISAFTQLANSAAQVIGLIFGKVTTSSNDSLATQNKNIASSAAAGAEAEEKLAEATKKAGKEAKKSIAGFDELTTLQDKAAGGGDSGSPTASAGGSSGGLSSGSTEVKVEDTISPQIKAMADKIKNGQWSEVASELTKALNESIKSIKWSDIGKNLGGYLNNALVFLATAVGEFDWMGLGSAIGDSIMGLWNSIDWGTAGKGLSDGVVGIIQTISTAIKKIDWKKIGKDVAKFLKGIDWAEVTAALFDGIGTALGGLAAFLLGLLEDAWTGVVEWWRQVAYEDGHFTMEGLLQGILDVFKNIGKWIKTNVFDPFINGFKSAFGIHSPSTVMAEMGKYLIQGLFNGISEAWTLIKEFISNSVVNIQNTIFNAWDTIKNSTTWQTISTNLKNTWEGIRTSASEKFENTKNSVLNAWDAIKNSSAWSTIRTNLYSAWDDIKSKAESRFSVIRDTISNAWNSAMGVFTTTDGKVDFSVIGTAVKDAFASGVNKLIAGLNDALYRIIYKINDIILDARAIHFEILGKTHYPFLNIPTIPQLSIPYLAKGAVIPPNAPFMAMLGDQRHGTNIEAPLSTIQEAVALVMEDMTGGMMAGFEATVAVLREILEAILGIEIGDTVIAEAVERYNRKMAVVKGG